MSARFRRLTTAGSLSLALALTTPAAAFADHREEHDPKGPPSEQGSERRDDGRSGSGSQGGSAGSGSSGSGSSGSSTSGSADKRSKKPASGKSGDGRAAGGDPRGNNGTIKIDGEAFDDGRGNEPHVGCVFELDFYGFDAGDTATITFTGHAPTGGGLLHSESRTLISTDAAGGGQDRDATLRYSVADQLSELLDVAPHAQQGWHVKVAVDVDSAPGGAKQKVFWIDCPQSAPLSGTSNEAASGGGTDVAVTTQSVPQAPTFGSAAVGVAAAPDNRLSVRARSVTARGEAAAGAATAGAATVSARGAVQPSALPFTGAQGMAALLALGLGTVGLGALVQRFGRRSVADLG